MVEIGFMALVAAAAGSLFALARNRQQRRQLQQRLPHDELSRSDGRNIRDIPAKLAIAADGHYQWGTPSYPGHTARFSDLQLIDGHLSLRDTFTRRIIEIALAEIQWVSAIEAEDMRSTLMIHAEIQQRWRTLFLSLKHQDMLVLSNVLRRAINAARHNLGGTPVRPVGPLAARIAGQNWQGETTLGAPVSLYLLPRLLVVLHNDIVQAKLDLNSIRRVLAVERISSGLGSLLVRDPQVGLLRLHSMNETVAFALAGYDDLADEIGYLSRCPVEHVSRAEKQGKV